MEIITEKNYPVLTGKYFLGLLTVNLLISLIIVFPISLVLVFIVKSSLLIILGIIFTIFAIFNLQNIIDFLFRNSYHYKIDEKGVSLPLWNTLAPRREIQFDSIKDVYFAQDFLDEKFGFKSLVIQHRPVENFLTKHLNVLHTNPTSFDNILILPGMKIEDAKILRELVLSKSRQVNKDLEREEIEIKKKENLDWKRLILGICLLFSAFFLGVLLISSARNNYIDSDWKAGGFIGLLLIAGIWFIYDSGTKKQRESKVFRALIFGLITLFVIGWIVFSLRIMMTN